MKFISILYFAALYLFFFTFSFLIYSQEENPELEINYNELYNSIQNEYGFDQELINGVYYENYYFNPIGHPFLLENKFYNGSIKFKEKFYHNIDIKFDIYENRLILFYSQNNANVLLVLPNEYLSEFILEGKTFRQYINDKSERRFYEVIYDSVNIKCLYLWSKDRINSNHNIEYMSYKFIKSKKKSYVLIEEKLMKYYNNKTFTKIFPERMQNDIKKYLKINRIQVNESNNYKLQNLLVYCNNNL